MDFVDLDQAKGADGLRLVVLKGAASPWSQAAKAIVEIKGIEALGVWKRPGDDAVQAWTGQSNAPVAMLKGEPAYDGWAEILCLAERLAPTPRLVPEDIEQRMRMFGLAHELMGQQGLTWHTRLVMVAQSLETDGARGFPVPIAKYLGARYGYTPGAAEGAYARVVAILQALDAQLQAHSPAGPYYFGAELTALDIYSATSMDALAPLPEAQCPMHPRTRAAFEARYEELRDRIPQSLLVHRDMMHARHIPLPMQV